MSKQNQVLADATFALAKTYLGQKEATGHNDGTFVRTLQRWLADGAKWMDGQPWCATFATYCMKKAAGKMDLKTLLPKNGSSTDIYAFAKKHGLLLDHPAHGCIGLLKGTGGESWKTHHHTFLVDQVNGDMVTSIDGNWKNAVTHTSHKIAGCDFVALT